MIFSKNPTLLKRYMYLHITVILLILIVNGLFYIPYSKSLLSSNALEESQKRILVANDSLDSTIQSAEDFLFSVVTNQNIQDYLVDVTPSSRVKKIQEIENQLLNLNESSSLISSIQLLSGGNVYFYSDDNLQRFSFNKNYEQETWFEPVSELRGGSYMTVLSHHVDDHHLSIIREINHLDSLSTIGIGIASINSDAIHNLFKSQIDSFNTNVVIVDAFQTPQLTINWQEDLNPLLSTYDLTKNESTIINFDNSTYILSSVKNENSGLYIVMLSEFNNDAFRSSSIFMMSFLLIIINLILVFISGLLITRNISKPLHTLVDSMNDVIDHNNFSKLDMPVHYQETSQMKKIYNEMIDSITNLLDSKKRDYHRKRHLEIQLLQAQIKPHFLYNTLETISSLSMANQSAESYKLTKALSIYYRISLSSGREVISLGEELLIAQNYLEIMSTRYPDLFDYSITNDYPDDFIEMPKLTIQPFIENAIYHGIKNLGELGTIYIKTNQIDDHLVITIEDNGIGMSPEKLKKITTTHHETKESFGVLGTIEKLNLFYNQSNLITLTSNKSIGTTVTILIPLTHDMEDL